MNERPAIAVIGLGCRYPGAATLREFWENVVARRRQFRRLPGERFPLDDYYSEDRSTPDKTYAREAAVIDGFEFDWVGRGIPKPIFEAADVVHWLSLEVALAALEDAGYAMADGMPKERAGVILGNTLTGEHTRANTMRLRWPFIERAIRAAAQTKGLPPEMTEQLAATTEQYFKSVFPPTTEDTLAGSLSNTIAGRICGYLGLHGGGYTVDGACSSSLIAVATAADALCGGSLDVALAGGVDVSLDTFEMIGFSKAGALTEDDLRVYDRGAKGFKPGEGCGFVVLKQLDDARADGDYVYAVLRGWGLASDGSRAITAPKAEGQARAIRRAYEHAGYGPHDLTFVEGHGTGTAVGDAIELTGIGQAVEADGPAEPRTCGVTSLKSIIGHTKAASGVGGLIKAIMGANRRVLAPIANCTEPHEVFDDAARALYPIMQGEVRPASDVFRVGVSAAGFGGMNCHVTLESGDAPAEHLAPAIDERTLFASSQETELFVMAAASIDELIERVDAVRALADGISYAEMLDLAAKLAREVDATSGVRAALLAGTPTELLDKCDALGKMLRERPPQNGQVTSTPDRSIWIGNQVDRAQAAFLFPGQGSQMLNVARTLVERFEWARELVDDAAEWLGDFGLEGIKELMYRPVDGAVDADQVDEWNELLKRTEVAQPAICLASLLWLEHLKRLEVEPAVVGGHSLGELSAFYAAGAFDAETLIRLAAIRGRAMADGADAPGAMASLACLPEVADQMVREHGGDVVVANLNSFSQTVISGDPDAVEAIVERAKAEGMRAKVLPVSNAFHSGHVAGAAERVRREASLPGFLETTRTRLFTSIDGSPVAEGLDLNAHFADQVVSQVHFIAMIAAMCSECDVFVEVGPGRVLSGLVSSICGADGPLCLPVESKPGCDRDLNTLVGCLFARGATIRLAGLYERRLVREFVPANERRFIENPCERPFKADGVELPRRSATGGALEAMIARQAGVAPEVLDDYVARRGQFLAAVVRADLATAGQELGAVADMSIAPVATEPATAEPAAAKTRAAAPSTGEAEEADASIPQMLLEAIEGLTGFPPESMSMDMRLIDDLNLDSIKAAELIASVAKRLGIAGELDPSQVANATLDEVSDHLAALARPAETSQAAPAHKTSKQLPTWVRNFVVDCVEEAPQAADPAAPTSWTGRKVLVLSEVEEIDVAEAVRDRLAGDGARVVCRAFDNVPGEGPVEGNYNALIAILPREKRADDSAADRLKRMIHRLRSTAAVPRARERSRSATVAYVQFGGGDFGESHPEADVDRMCAKAVGASLALERDDLKVRVVDFAPEAAAAAVAEKLAVELATSESFEAVGYDAELTRRIPRLRLSEAPAYPKREIEWSADDVILVTGGAKGITAECVLAVAERTGARMALVGSSPLGCDDENGKPNAIAQTLARFAGKGLTAQYFQCDVADADAVARLVDEVEAEMGPITGVVHGAAVNKPRLVGDVSRDEAFREVAPKVLGTVNLCRALADRPPKLFVGLSSIIGVSGMWRNGWYGFSNETMTRLMARFQDEHPQTAVVALAYSVWDEVGMGFRMGSTDYLASRGVAAIPADEGVRRFVGLFEGDPGRTQVVIAARIDRVSGLESTLRFADLPEMPRANRFLEEIDHICPGVEVVSRMHLDVERDPYLKDHVWKGSHLFPTVFGLEAMAQAVGYVTAWSDFENVRIENICLDRPIVVDAEAGQDVRIRAEVLERSADDAPVRVKAGISTAMSDFTRDHFSAEFVLQRDPADEFEEVRLPDEPLPIDPRRDLYGDLLFQGPSFQRLAEVYSLASTRCVFASKIAPGDDPEDFGLLGDACYRDSLLQSVQLMSPQEIALPVRIDSLRRRSLRDRAVEKLTAVAVYQGEADGERTFSVFAVDADGRVVERLEGYTLGIVERRPENPTAEQIADPTGRDEQILRENLEALTAALDVEAPERCLVHMPGLHDLPRHERHGREMPIMARVAEAVIGERTPQERSLRVRWLGTGKPVVEGTADEHPEVSLSHDDYTLLCVGGRGPQGCDVHPVQRRNRDDWVALLSNARTPLLDELVDGDSLDRAGTRLWCAQEAALKATGDRRIELRLRGRSGQGVVFEARTENARVAVLTFPVKLTFGPEKIVAVVVRTAEDEELEAEARAEAENRVEAAESRAQDEPALAASPATHPRNDPALLASLGFDSGQYRMEMTEGPRGEPVLIVRWPLSFRDNRTPGGGLYFSNYFAWMGKIREMAISPILDRLAQDMAGGQWGMVTNNGDVRVLGDVTGSGVVEAHAWMEGLGGRDQSTIELHFEWHRVAPDGTRRPIATGQMQITWVRVLGHGQVAVAPLPEYVQEYMRAVAPRGNRPEAASADDEAALPLGDELYRTSHGPRAGRILRETTFQTSLEDANLVGNIYFDNYTKWQGRLRDLFLFDVAPELYSAGAPRGELMVRRCRVHHIREAMPFDRIHVSMGLRAVHENGVRLEFDYSRINPDGSREKLAFSEQEAVWVTRDADGRPAEAPLPAELLDQLCHKSEV